MTSEELAAMDWREIRKAAGVKDYMLLEEAVILLCRWMILELKDG